MTEHGSQAAKGAARHTVVVTTVQKMWEKLAWNIAQFEDIQRSYPEDPEPLAFAAIDVCIAASSLRDWAKKEYRDRRKAEGKPVNDIEILRLIRLHVPLQNMCDAIANTGKHRDFGEGRWVNGEVRIERNDADQDTEPGYVLKHVHEGAMESIALNAFKTLRQTWWGALQSMGFAFDATPEWERSRHSAEFGE